MTPCKGPSCRHHGSFGNTAREGSAQIAPPPRTLAHPLTKLSEVPPDLAAVRFLASLIQTWSSPPSPVLPRKSPTQ